MPAKRMLIAAAFFGLALFMAVSFVSYDGVNSAVDRSPLANMGGEVGIALSDVLLYYFGAGSFAI
ncbi:MAG: DNA translocase FtsK 4TM domain-containing protein, partial [Planctomycetes bacterium]|nr:DNA translocase FtsK 4TM domain-containing protein [Planctomycetota bacterium]